MGIPKMAMRYHWMPTRHLRMRRRSRFRVPSFPSTILVTRKAASAGPAIAAGMKESMTAGAGRPIGMRPKPDLKRTVGSRTSQPPKKARMKNATSGCLVTMRLRSGVVGAGGWIAVVADISVAPFLWFLVLGRWFRIAMRGVQAHGDPEI